MKKIKLNSRFVLGKIADTWFAVPLDPPVPGMGGMIKLNSTSALLWRALTDFTEEQTLCQLLQDQYQIDRELALADVNDFLKQLYQYELLDEHEFFEKTP